MSGSGSTVNGEATTNALQDSAERTPVLETQCSPVRPRTKNRPVKIYHLITLTKSLRAGAYAAISQALKTQALLLLKPEEMKE